MVGFIRPPREIPSHNADYLVSVTEDTEITALFKSRTFGSCLKK